MDHGGLLWSVPQALTLARAGCANDVPVLLLDPWPLWHTPAVAASGHTPPAASANAETPTTLGCVLVEPGEMRREEAAFVTTRWCSSIAGACPPLHPARTPCSIGGSG